MSVPEDLEGWQPLPTKVISTPFAEKVRKLNRDLTAQLFLRRGPFWDAVSDMRARWEISAPRQLPDLPDFVCWPSGLPEEYQGQWLNDLTAIERRVIPENIRKRGHLWWRFTAACVLFDPPDSDLLEFASFSDPQPVPLLSIEPGRAEPAPTPEEVLERANATFADMFNEAAKQLGTNVEQSAPKAPKRVREMLMIAVAPIARIRDPDEVEEVERWFWGQVMRRLIERYIRPQGLDVDIVLHDVLDSSGLLEEYLDRKEQVSESYYVLVDEYTTEEDLEGARRMIRATQKRDSGGRPPRDTLVALQCAVLHDQYNETDPTDKRYKRWTYKRLSEHFRALGVRNARSAEEHTKLGRRLLKNRLT